MMTAHDAATLAMAEFLNGQPFSVSTYEHGSLQEYDIEYCKRDGRFYAHQSGCGGEPMTYCPSFWATPGVVVRTVGTIAPLSALPDPWTEQKLLALTESEDTHCAWCLLCQDYLPTDNPCAHIWWCDVCAWWSTPDNECEHREDDDE